jgi:hypothetical protein
MLEAKKCSNLADGAVWIEPASAVRFPDHQGNYREIFHFRRFYGIGAGKSPHSACALSSNSLEIRTGNFKIVIWEFQFPVPGNISETSARTQQQRARPQIEWMTPEFAPLVSLQRRRDRKHDVGCRFDAIVRLNR